MRFVMIGCRSLRGELHAARERPALRARQAERHSRARKSVRGPGGTPRRRRQPCTSVLRRQCRCQPMYHAADRYYTRDSSVPTRPLLHQINSALHTFVAAKSSASFGWGKGRNVTCAGCQVTLCDPMRPVSSRSGEASLRTAIHV